MVEDTAGKAGRSWPKKTVICKGFLWAFSFFPAGDGQIQKNDPSNLYFRKVTLAIIGREGLPRKSRGVIETNM